jgi:hypothetical protein
MAKFCMFVLPLLGLAGSMQAVALTRGAAAWVQSAAAKRPSPAAVAVGLPDRNVTPAPTGEFSPPGASRALGLVQVGEAMALPSRFAPAPQRSRLGADLDADGLPSGRGASVRWPALAWSPGVLSRLSARAAPAEQVARRIQREGLPFARLWQTRSAMLSLGLNAKGKPGLWLVQKIP